MVDVNELNVIEDNVQDLENESDPSEYFSDDSIEEEPYHNVELHDAGEAETDEEDVLDEPTYDEIIAELQEHIVQMDEEAVQMIAMNNEQEVLIDSLRAEKLTTAQIVKDRTEVLERRWLDEAEKSHQLQLQLDAAKDEVLELKKHRHCLKRKFCGSLFDLQTELNEFPKPKGDLGYEINRSVATSMIHKVYEEIRKYPSQTNNV